MARIMDSSGSNSIKYLAYTSDVVGANANNGLVKNSSGVVGLDSASINKITRNVSMTIDSTKNFDLLMDDPNSLRQLSFRKNYGIIRVADGGTHTEADVQVSKSGSASLTASRDDGAKTAGIQINATTSATSVSVAADNVAITGTLNINTATSTNANYTIPVGFSIIQLVAITANRTVTVPNGVNVGDIMYIDNQTSANAWNISGTVKTAARVAITAFTNQFVTQLYWDGSAWIKMN
jgi:hypothetical protein